MHHCQCQVLVLKICVKISKLCVCVCVCVCVSVCVCVCLCMQEGGDQTVVVGAASKGIIQRDHQHNAVVYRSYYAANPFENMSEEEVNAYKQEVQRQEQGEEPGNPISAVCFYLTQHPEAPNLTCVQTHFFFYPSE